MGDYWKFKKEEKMTQPRTSVESRARGWGEGEQKGERIRVSCGLPPAPPPAVFSPWTQQGLLWGGLPLFSWDYFLGKAGGAHAQGHAPFLPLSQTLTILAPILAPGPSPPSATP